MICPREYNAVEDFQEDRIALLVHDTVYWPTIFLGRYVRE